jgi:hypothetical protein
MPTDIARLIRDAAGQPPPLVPEVPPTAEEMADRYRQRFEHTAPTLDQIQEWRRLLRRHRPDEADPYRCRSCPGTPYPCQFRLSAEAALTAAECLDNARQVLDSERQVRRPDATDAHSA